MDSQTLYSLVSTREGRLLGRVRLDAPEAPRLIMDWITQAGGEVVITIEEEQDAEAARGATA